MKNNRVYLAGPDVFFPDVDDRSEVLKIQCDLWNLDGVFPLDANIKLEEPINQEKNGYTIFEGNLGLIDSCAAILANISPFRGPSADSGTAFEMGYGRARGLVIACYTTHLSLYKDRAVPDGLMIEDFGMIDNLMIHGAAKGKIFKTSSEAIKYIAECL
jgi:nucleoside 2-deoxyribosyltransferase